MISSLKSVSSNSIAKLKSNSVRHSTVDTLKLDHFPKALATNDDTLFLYIKSLISGSILNQKNYNQYVFNHLKNTIDHQFNSLTLRNTCKFIMTLILLGNLHIYQNIIKYLLPGMMQKINDTLTNNKSDQIKPVWHLSQFCLETLYVLAEWLPQDFRNSNKVSIFAKIKEKYNLHIAEFKYFNMDKIVFCYRIIKQLGITNHSQDKCYICDQKTSVKKQKANGCYKFKKKFHQKSNLEHRQSMFVKQNGKKQKDIIWETGFQLLDSIQENLSQTPSQQLNQFSSSVVKTKSKRFWSPNQYECFNKKQILEKEEKLQNKLIKINQNIKQADQNLYNLQQKKLVKQYQFKKLKQQEQYKNKNEAKNVQLKYYQNQTKKSPKKYQQNPEMKISGREQTGINKEKLIYSLQTLSSPLKLSRKVDFKIQKLGKIKKQLIFNHIQIFTNYLNSKSYSFQKKFKIALLSSKGNIYLKNVGSYSLKCKSFCRENKVKIKFFASQNKQQKKKNENLQNNNNDQSNNTRVIECSKLFINSQIKENEKDLTYPSMKLQFIEPKIYLESCESNDEKTELIIKFGSNKSEKQFIYEPIIIKLNNQVMYLPIGYWHLVKQNSKQMIPINQNQYKKGSQCENYQKIKNQFRLKQFKLVYTRTKVDFNNQEFKTLQAFVMKFEKQFQVLVDSSIKNQLQNQHLKISEKSKKMQINRIILKGQVIGNDFFIQLVKQKDSVYPNQIQIKGYIRENLDENSKKEFYFFEKIVAGLIQQLVFIFSDKLVIPSKI